MKTVVYRCENCGHVFEDTEAVVHWGSRFWFLSDMDACPKCDSEDLTEVATSNKSTSKIIEVIRAKKQRK